MGVGGRCAGGGSRTRTNAPEGERNRESAAGAARRPTTSRRRAFQDQPKATRQRKPHQPAIWPCVMIMVRWSLATGSHNPVRAIGHFRREGNLVDMSSTPMHEAETSAHFTNRRPKQQSDSPGRSDRDGGVDECRQAVRVLATARRRVRDPRQRKVQSRARFGDKHTRGPGVVDTACLCDRLTQATAMARRWATAAAPLNTSAPCSSYGRWLRLTRTARPGLVSGSVSPAWAWALAVACSAPGDGRERRTRRR